MKAKLSFEHDTEGLFEELLIEHVDEFEYCSVRQIGDTRVYAIER